MNIEVRDFELHLCYFVLFHIKTVWKGMNTLIPQLWVKLYPTTFLLKRWLYHSIDHKCWHVVHSISFQTFLYRHLIQNVIAIQLMRQMIEFYDFRFKWTATAATGIHPSKAWLSQLVNFKNAIWTWQLFRRTICNKLGNILKNVLNLEKCHRNVWNASHCFSTILHESSINFWVA